MPHPITHDGLTHHILDKHNEVSSGGNMFMFTDASDGFASANPDGVDHFAFDGESGNAAFFAELETVGSEAHPMEVDGVDAYVWTFPTCVTSGE